MTMKKIFLLLFIALLGNAAIAQITDYSIFDKKFNFYVANDLGRNGYYDQKPIAELMGQMAEEVGPEFVLATGDVHHFEGVRSVNDPLWMTNYELIYSHPELMIDWFPLLGNHEYRGNTQAVLDYSNISRRWTMPARYYTKTFEDNGATIRILWVDTAPMIDKYRNESETYPAACHAYVLEVVDVPADVHIHLVLAQDGIETCLHIRTFALVLRGFGIDGMVSGNDNPVLFGGSQHVRVAGSDIDYITNSAGSLARKVKPIEGTVFCSPEPGFSIVSASKKTLELRMIDKKGNVLHTVTRSK